MKKFYRLSFFLLITLSIASCIGTGGKPKQPPFVIDNEDKIEMTLRHTPHEECFAVQANQEIDFAFITDGDVDFNLHYHVGRDIYYPVKEEDINRYKGVYTPEKKQIYCLMWTNYGEDSIPLTYYYTVNDKK